MGRSPGAGASAPGSLRGSGSKKRAKASGNLSWGCPRRRPERAQALHCERPGGIQVEIPPR
eukprot:3576570-Alexandrium_andersonii.AAC.1